jgi:putative transposase
LAWHARFRGDDLFHHIYAWGNDHHPIFKERYHYQRYLSYLEKYSIKHKVDVIAYALMRDHVHLFMHDLENKISEFMLHMHGEYAKYYNWSSHRVGHVFGERYNNKIVEANEYGMWLTRYIHRQALKKGIVTDPVEYPWTSYRIYIGLDRNVYLKNAFIIDQFGSGKEADDNYRNFVMDNDDGPIDWSVIERDQFRKNGKVEEICKNLGIDVDGYRNVQDKAQRKNRNKLILQLLNDYGLKAVEIAEYFNITKSAISHIIKRY